MNVAHIAKYLQFNGNATSRPWTLAHGILASVAGLGLASFALQTASNTSRL